MADSWTIEKHVQWTTNHKRVVTWYWYVWCDGEEDPVGSGPQRSKKDAQAAGRTMVNRIKCQSVGGGGNNNSGGIYVGEDGKIYRLEIRPPAINASIVDGHLEYFEVINPWTDEFHRFTTDEISENELSWLAGLCFYDETLSQKYELVATQLKTWHVYLGGNSPTEIMTLHNLSAEHFEMIASKSWNKVSVHKTENTDGTVHLDWDIES